MNNELKVKAIQYLRNLNPGRKEKSDNYDDEENSNILHEQASFNKRFRISKSYILIISLLFISTITIYTSFITTSRFTVEDTTHFFELNTHHGDHSNTGTILNPHELFNPPKTPMEHYIAKRPIVIGLMTHHFFGPAYEGSVPNCPHKCGFVRADMKSQQNQWKKQADALWYHLPAVKKLTPIEKAHSAQLQVIMSLESASYYPLLNDEQFMKKFDVEMTYRQKKAQVPLSYFDSYSNLNLLNPPSTPANNRTQAVIYLQSNCEARSNRHSIVKAMVEASIVPIHAAGACAKQLGKVHEPSKILTTGRLPDKNIIGTYAFCIAMENSIDEDYVTEKIWDALNSGCVPIYYGSPTIRSILPDPNAVILYDDFLKEDNPVAAMTNELKRLLDDPKAYEEKLAWKGKPLEELSEGFQEYVMRVKMISDGRCVLCTQALEERLRVYRLERLRKEARKR